MDSKRITMMCAAVGGILGGMVPQLWGASGFSITTLVFNALGACVGIWMAFKMTRL